MLSNRRDELEVSCVREDSMRRGAARTAVLSMFDRWIKDSVSVERAMEQRKGEVWTLELEKLSDCFVIMIFSRDENEGHVERLTSRFWEPTFLVFTTLVPFLLFLFVIQQSTRYAKSTHILI